VRRAAIAALLLAAAASAPAADSDDAAIAAAHAEIDAGHYLAGVRQVETVVFAGGRAPEKSDYKDNWQQYGAMLSEERPLVAALPATLRYGQMTAALREVSFANALPAIVARARMTSIVILNESHADPRSRAFGLEVARALRPLGYRTLALETLNNTADDAQSAAMMAALQRDGYVRHRTGVYTQDPAYADFVRQALALGYRPVAYEQARPYAGFDAREQDQADFLARRAAPKRADGDKLFVYVGYGHAAENPILDGKRPMAARLKAITGIDPLTIDQSTLAGDDAGSESDRAYQSFASRIGDRTAVLLRDGKPFVWGQNAGAVDLQVVHPPIRHVSGRPDWLLGMGRAPSPIPPALLPAHGIRLVQAFLADEAPDAIPIDQVLVVAGRPAPALMLPPGKAVRYATEDDPGVPPLHAARQ
jgi:hypothetical protein